MDQANGVEIADAIRLVPLAVQAQQTLYFIHPDHLNTPRLVADGVGATVWQWDQQEAFGSNWANENPGGAGIFDMPLRFPGQYFDAETGLHYNYYRDFDPRIGAYKESDPIGLRAGLNTYSYVRSDPLRYTDEFGLVPACQGDDCRMVIELTWRYSGYCGSPCIATSGYLQYWNCAPRFRYKEAGCDCSNIWRFPKG